MVPSTPQVEGMDVVAPLVEVVMVMRTAVLLVVDTVAQADVVEVEVAGMKIVSAIIPLIEAVTYDLAVLFRKFSRSKRFSEIKCSIHLQSQKTFLKR
jgi:hypothetical protein